MSNVGVDVRLRRQIPVTAKPPKLLFGIRAISSQQHGIRRLLQQQDTFTSQASTTTNTGTFGAPHSDRRGSPSYSSDCSENPSSSITSGNRPLIHHQRQNLKNRFQLLKTLGEGAYGKVKLAADKATGEHVAIKYIKKTKIEDENDLIRIRREIQILSSLNHPHIVNIREVFERKDKIVLVLDYAQGGELYEYLNRMGKLAENEARRIFRQIVSAIYYCHQNGIVHRDLKLENIILDDAGNVKIADFGLANYYSLNNTLKTFCGSPLYASPEIVNGRPYHGPEVDVWSLGVILYTLVYGAMPFESDSLVSLKQQISEGDYNQPSKPSEAAGLIRHLLTVTPSRRATMEDVLNHWWVNFGHKTMPNDQLYSPEEELPLMPYGESRSLSCRSDRPTVIHQRNQSSISSDSDIELDFRPNRWSKRTISLDSTGNSVSSSVTSSPAATPDSSRHLAHDHIDDDPAAIVSGLLKLPPDVLDIVKGCSSYRSLAGLLKKDIICADLDTRSKSISNNSTTFSVNEEESIRKNSAPELLPAVFDSERKPTRGILKRRGKFSGSEIGCVLPDEMAGRSNESTVPKSGHLPKRLPSFRDEAHGIFASKHQASQLLNHTSDSLHLDSLSTAMLHPTWSHPYCLLPKQEPQYCNQTADNLQNITATQTENHECGSNTINNFNTDHSTPFCQEHLSSKLPDQEPVPAEQQSITNNNAKPTITEFTPESGPSKVVYRPKGILKKTSFDEGRNRLSISSIGSNSSADILDLSYDSGDSDHFVNLGEKLPPEAAVKDDVGEVLTSDQRRMSLDERLLSLQISGISLSLSYQGRHRSKSSVSGEVCDSSSSMICGLTVEAQRLQ